MFDINFVIIYLSLEGLCGALVLLMAYRMNRSIGRANEVFVFHGLALAAILEILSDCMWAVDGANGVSMPRAAEYAYNMLSLISTGCVTWLWYLFLDLRIVDRSELMLRRKFSNILAAVPFLILTAGSLLAPVNHAVFSVAEDGTYLRGPWYGLQIFCCYCYLLAALVHLLYSVRRRNLEQATALTFLFSTVSICIGGLLQVAKGAVPFTTIFYTLGMYFLFAELQSRRIYTDALTGLNNRAKAREYLDSRIQRAGKEPFYLFIADIDNFKSINDRYGHLSGDEALVHVARNFQEMCQRYRTLFLSRYGGDEFLFLFSVSEGNPVEFQKQFAELLSANMKNSCLPYDISVSFGYVIAASADTDRERLIAAADEMLYGQKRRAHEEMGMELSAEDMYEGSKGRLPDLGSWDR